MISLSCWSYSTSSRIQHQQLPTEKELVSAFSKKKTSTALCTKVWTTKDELLTPALSLPYHDLNLKLFREQKKLKGQNNHELNCLRAGLKKKGWHTTNEETTKIKRGGQGTRDNRHNKTKARGGYFLSLHAHETYVRATKLQHLPMFPVFGSPFMLLLELGYLAICSYAMHWRAIIFGSRYARVKTAARSPSLTRSCEPCWTVSWIQGYCVSLHAPLRGSWPSPHPPTPPGTKRRKRNRFNKRNEEKTKKTIRKR